MEHDLTFRPDPRAALRRLSALPGFAATPLRTLARADACDVLIKDERQRLGLPAFKALGGIHAVGVLAEAARAGGNAAPVFVCASAGNHGLAVATGARLAGAAARVHLPAETPAPFAKRLRTAGAEVVLGAGRYDETLLDARADAAASGAILLSDTVEPGGDPRPAALVMEGYTLIAEELRAVFEVSGRWPTDVYLQAGVGGLAAALAHMIRATWRVQPRLVIVEPDAAACLAASARAGRPVRIEGPDSVMGRLDCKAPSVLAHAVLARCDVGFMAVSDAAAEAAADRLAYAGLATTPSGAAGFAALLADDLPRDTRPLIILTEAAL